MTARRLLIGLECVMGVVAIVCGWLLMTGREDRLKMDPHVLDGSPFDTFRIPGAVLTTIVGGTNLAAALSLLSRRSWGAVSAFVAGCALMGWMVGQVILLGFQGPRWQQPFYFLWGLVSAILALRLRVVRK